MQWIILFCLLSGPAMAAELDFNVLKTIESGNNPLAIGKTGDIGLYQITDICRRDYNQFHTRKYTRRDLFNASINEDIAKWYLTARIPQFLRMRHKPWTIDNVIICWNAGIKYVWRDLPPVTKKYLIKYHKIARQ